MFLLPAIANQQAAVAAPPGGTTYDYSFESDAQGFKATAAIAGTDRTLATPAEVDFATVTTGTADATVNRRSGSTPSSGTGPSSASDGTYYLYVEGSGILDNYDQHHVLLPDTYDGTTGLRISFDYSQVRTQDNQALGLQWFYLPDGANFQTGWEEVAPWIYGQTTADWVSQVYQLDGVGDNVRLKFVWFAKDGGGSDFAQDQAIDNISVEELTTAPLLSQLTVGAWSTLEIEPLTGRWWYDPEGSDKNAVVRVRRSSDNTHEYVTATEVSDGTLTTFTGANDGLVNQLLDQSGHERTLYNDTAADQPLLVDSGTVENNANSDPALVWNDDTDFLSYDSPPTSAEVTYFMVVDIPNGLEDAGGTQNYELFSSTAADRVYLQATTNGNYILNFAAGGFTDGTQAARSVGISARDTILLTFIRNNNTGVLQVRVNGSLARNNTSYTQNSTAVCNQLGKYINVAPGTSPGPVSFWAIVTKDLSANIGDYESAIASKFGITLA